MEEVMPFKPMASMDNYGTKNINAMIAKIKESNLDPILAFTEKIDGMNGGIHITIKDGDIVDYKYSKRHSYIETTHKSYKRIFSNKQESGISLDEELRGFTQNFVDKLTKIGHTPKIVRIYGEFYGGEWNTKDYSSFESVKINGGNLGVLYSPYNRFIVFRVYMDGIFMDYTTFQDLLTDSGFNCAPILFTCKLSELDEYFGKDGIRNVDRNEDMNISKISEMHGHSKIENNYFEGLVGHIVGKSLCSGGYPFVLKIKRSDRTEIANPTKPIKLQKKLNVPNADEKVIKMIITDLNESLNMNRIMSVMSKGLSIMSDEKIPRIGKISAVINAVIEDAFYDYTNRGDYEIYHPDETLSEEFKIHIEEIYKKNKKTIVKQLTSQIREEVEKVV